MMNEWNNIKLLKISEPFEPKKFWKSLGTDFGDLSDLVLRLYSMEAGISNLERKFSIWRHFQNKQRFGLSDEKLVKLLFIRFNSDYCDNYK